MTQQEIIDQLEQIGSVDNFEDQSAQLTEAWSNAGVGLEAVDSILQFMEQHPNIDFGMPGSLVHFVEDFYGNGYEEKLVQSVQRKPTAHTVWMLNRVINGTKTPDAKHRLRAIMEQAKLNPLADVDTIQAIDHFVEP